MNFEDQSEKGFGRFTSGTSKRRFFAGLLVAAILIIGVFIQEQETKSQKKILLTWLILLWVRIRNINCQMAIPILQ